MKPPPEAPRFYTTQLPAVGEELLLEEGPSRHIAGALRLKPGATLRLFNGRGGEYFARLVDVGKRQVNVAVEEFLPEERESPLPISLGLALSRGERMDYAVQKSTELGVAKITPLFTERTEVRLKGDRLEKKQRHWEQVAISACEQCGRNRPPLIEPVRELGAWLSDQREGCRLVLHHRATASLTELSAPAAATLLVGPEGGLSGDEIAAAESAGFQALKLGPRVLRTETAPVAALSILQFHWGDMQ